MEKTSLSYGAEELQRSYPKSLLISLLISTALVVGAFLYPVIKSVFLEKKETPLPVKVKTTINYSQLQAPPPIDLERELPDPMEAVPKVKTKKYLPPVPKKDEEVVEELPTMEELSHVAIGAQDIEGIDSVVVDQVPSETEVISEPVEPPQEVFSFAEVMPEFIGGQEEFRDYLSKNLKYPPLAKENEIQGRVFVSFIVEPDGSISNVQIVRSVNPLLDAEAKRVIEDMPNWKPGMQNQVPVRVSFTLPISFTLR